ncbi:uncharacterized protein [Temnothorax nylanderi]|uniref:uncharacterized protein isoform X3 n=1 Tax=Temnothorax nylanderi TaxID=102681 RepID=UPI003A893CA1
MFSVLGLDSPRPKVSSRTEGTLARRPGSARMSRGWFGDSSRLLGGERPYRGPVGLSPISCAVRVRPAPRGRTPQTPHRVSRYPRAAPSLAAGLAPIAGFRNPGPEARCLGEESSSKQITQLKSDLENVTSKLTVATNDLASLQMSLEKEQSSNSSLCLELAHLREFLESERAAVTELRVFLEKERDEKDSALLRNAQMSQDIEIVKQENRQHKIENMELQSKVENLEDDLMGKVKEAKQVIITLKEFEQKVMKLEEAERTREKLEGNEKILKSSLLDLEEQMSEKNKTIKILQQRLTDMKKTLQRELKIPSSSLDNDANASAAILNPSSSQTVTARHNNSREDDVNFKYLKHVLIKFLTSREYEALHLTRAVATLLHFSPEEERLLQETLEWKMSWFGTRPNLGFGQTAKAIPPS